MVSLNYMTYHGRAFDDPYIVMWSEDTFNIAIEVTLAIRILGHKCHMHNSCLTWFGQRNIG
jgi:hypothetical protein